LQPETDREHSAERTSKTVITSDQLSEDLECDDSTTSASPPPSGTPGKSTCLDSGFEDSPYGVEWMRFDPDSPLPELVRTVAHVAFQVDDLERELEDQEVLIPPNSPSEGVRVAFIVHNGAPVELLEIADEGRPGIGGS
jgi:hypothetical protein